MNGTVLFVGAGRHQQRAIRHVRDLGLRVVAVDRNPEALWLREADVGEVVDFTDMHAVAEAGRRHAVDGVLTVSADRAVPVVAAVAERTRLADAGVPQPRYAAVRSVHEAHAALDTVGLPAVVKPADSGGQRGVFRVETRDDLDAHL